MNKFCKPETDTFIQVTRPFDKLNTDFKGPLPKSTTSNKQFILTIFDEYSHSLRAYAVNMSTNTVIKCLKDLFYMFELPSYMHSDRDAVYVLDELKVFLSC